MSQVLLHIYDVSTNPLVEKVNKVLSPVGTGAFHGGVEVHGKEYSYGFIEQGTGVFENEPKGCSMHRFRETLDLGPTQKTKEDVMKLLEKMKQEWPGVEYDLLRKNCVIFSSQFVKELGTTNEVPAWVTNLGAAGATVQNGAMQAGDAAQRTAIVAAAKANEFDKQYDISGTTKAKVEDLIKFAKDMDQKHNLTEKGQAHLDKAKVMAGQASEQAKVLTGQMVFKLNEMNDKHKVSETVQGKMGEADAAMKERMKGIGIEDRSEGSAPKKDGCPCM